MGEAKMVFKKGDLVAWFYDKTALAIVVEVGFNHYDAPFVRVAWLTDNSPEARNRPGREWDPSAFTLVS